jgi:hypothetical protein
MEWTEATIRFKPFKMADDIQRKAYMLQLNQAQKISDTTLLADADLRQEDEDEIMMRETAKRLQATRKQQLAMADVQGEAQLIQMKYQAKAQQAMAQEQGMPAPGEPGGAEGQMDPMAAQQQAQTAQQQQQAAQQQQMAMQAGGGATQTPKQGLQMMGMPSPEQMLPSGGVADSSLGGMPQEAQSQLGAGAQGGGMDIQAMAQMYAQQIVGMDPREQDMAIQMLQQQSPQLAQLVMQIVMSMQPQQQPTGVDQRPLPNQKPERRAAASV